MNLTMKKNTSKVKFTWIVTWLLVMSIFIADPVNTYAQTADGEWSPPVNLSRSGGALNPSIFVDNAGTTHIIWADAYAGFMYSVLGEEGWSAPKSVIFPFSPPRNVVIGPDYPTPVLISDQRNRIHAFWIDERGVLNHSSVNGLYFSSPGSWTGKRVMTDAAIAMDVSVDEFGNFHLVYIRNLSSIYSPAGLYYRNLNTTTFAWGLPVLLDESPYFRSIEPTSANVTISATSIDEAVHLMIGWDNRPRNRISLVRSIDAGKTWEEARVVEGPEVSTTPVTPFNILIGSFATNTVLVWQEDEPGESCNQVYQWSSDGGETWNGKQRMLTDLQGCAQDFRFLTMENGQMILMTKILGQVYFQAWDGQRWSDPQLQTILSSFIDQETFNLVNLNCQHALFTPSNDLFVAGCDQGIGGDVWLTSQRIESVSSWFSSDTNWSYPVSIANSLSVSLSSSMAVDETGHIHLTWSQLESESDEGATLQYARSDGQNWSPPQVLFGPPSNYVGDTTLLVSDGRLYAAWNEQLSGEIMIASAPADRAINPKEWSVPVSIPLPRNDGNSPTLISDEDGTLYLAFAISINEDRGIYMTQSEDRGATWSEAALVFDAVSMQWPMVDDPKWTIGDDGSMHLIFSRFNANKRPAGLYYVMSMDKVNWSEADVVSEAVVRFSDILAAPNGVIHVVWEESGNSFSIWHAYFNDVRNPWEFRRSIQTSIIQSQLSPLLNDANGNVHLLHVANEGRTGLTLKHWVWDEPQWNVADIYQIPGDTEVNASALLGAISENGQLAAVYALPVVDERVSADMSTIFAASVSLDTAGAGMAAPTEAEEIEEVATPAVTAIETSEVVPQPTAENVLIVEEYNAEVDTSPVDRQNQWSGLAIGVVVGGLLTILILMLAVRSVRRRGLK
jgi:hypothetical protein